MKARVKATGLVSEVCLYSPIYLEGVDNCFYPDEVEIVDTISDSPDYWTRLEHQAAIGAMQALLSSDTMMEVLSRRNNGTIEEEVAREAFDYAHALVEKIKEERK